MDFYPLRITSITPETDQAVTVAFALTDEQRASFSYQAGQYLTLRFVINGKEERRAYSMSSAPQDNELAVTVKRVSGGIVSNHIPDHLRVGDTVDVLPPQGRFLVTTAAAARKDYYLFGAGSGITPLMSILRTVLEEEPKSRVFLLYGNRDENNIIFRDALDQLVSRYAGQLIVEHTLSRPLREKQRGLRGLFSKGKINWPGPVGRLDIPAVQRFLAAHPGQAETKEYYICGPGQMIDNVEQALLGLGFAPEAIYSERFVSANAVRTAGTERGVFEEASITATVGGETHTVVLEPGQTILDGLLKHGAEPPYSCLAGACSTCMATVSEGGVKMDVCFALDDEEIAAGCVLACQAKATTEKVTLTFDV